MRYLLIALTLAAGLTTSPAFAVVHRAMRPGARACRTVAVVAYNNPLCNPWVGSREITVCTQEQE
jgi:hypothetical protein